MEAVVLVEEDGMDKLCIALYGSLKIAKMVGGNEAAVLYDAADKLGELQDRVAQLKALLDHRAMESVPNPPPRRAVDEDYLNSDKQLNAVLGKVPCSGCGAKASRVFNKELSTSGLDNGGVVTMEVERRCSNCGCAQYLKVPIYNNQYGLPEVTGVAASVSSSTYGHNNWSDWK